MALKNRLWIAFGIIIIVPIFMIAVCTKIILNYTTGSISLNYDVEVESVQQLVNPVRLLNHATLHTYNEIKLCVIREPKKLEDVEYLKKINRDLESKYSYLLVRKGRELYYTGAKQARTFFEKLPEFGNSNNIMEGSLYYGDREPLLIKQQDFMFSDGSEGSVFIITDTNVVMPQIRNLMIQAIVCMLIIILITALILIVWLYRGIIRPLNKLKSATNAMKEGNLDYAVTGNPNDEIGQLLVDFDKMRIHMKELMEERLQYEEDTRELISNISHDFKTPLTAIKGYSEGLLDGIAKTPDKQEKYLRTIYTKANDISALVDELSLFSKIDNNSVPYNFSVLNANEYLRDCVDDLFVELDVQQIDFEWKNDVSDDVEISVDTEQIKRVIGNIIGNSIKYLDKEKGRIRLGVYEEETQIRLEIEDNGCGISHKDMPNIFDRFFRGDASRNSNKGGSGLGLAIAKKIIEEHCGRIWADSVEGKGTTICFTIPKYGAVTCENREQGNVKEVKRDVKHENKRETKRRFHWGGKE